MFIGMILGLLLGTCIIMSLSWSWLAKSKKNEIIAVSTFAVTIFYAICVFWYLFSTL